MKLKFLFGSLLIFMMAALFSQNISATENPNGVVETFFIASDPGGAVLIAQAEVVSAPDVAPTGGNLVTSDPGGAALVAQAEVVPVPELVLTDGTLVVSDPLPLPEPAPFNIWKWLLANGTELIGGLMIFLKVVVRLTPWVKDDMIFGYVDKFIGWLFPNYYFKK